MNFKELENYCTRMLYLENSSYVPTVPHEDYFDALRAVLELLEYKGLATPKILCLVDGCEQEAKYIAEGNRVCYRHKYLSFCDICNRPAVTMIDGTALCIECYNKRKETKNE